jgi:hypothetical protein
MYGTLEKDEHQVRNIGNWLDRGLVCIDSVVTLGTGERCYAISNRLGRCPIMLVDTYIPVALKPEWEVIDRFFG